MEKYIALKRDLCFQLIFKTKNQSFYYLGMTHPYENYKVNFIK